MLCMISLQKIRLMQFVLLTPYLISVQVPVLSLVKDKIVQK